MMKRVLLKILTAAITLMIMLSAVSLTAFADEISVEPIRFNHPDFIRGMDVSSVLSLEEAGVVFRDREGAQRDLFRLLADNGVNYIRVRVWNDPYDAEGNGYGGGNNDVQKAVEIGRRAKCYGMKLLVDFHYSDFWADPSKQAAPKAWHQMTLNEKEQALYRFTLGSLNAIADGGADIGMVQIGNEINGGIAGESSWLNMSQLLKAGSTAVRAFSPDVKVAVHFTDPQNIDGIRALADFLHGYGVDYDVFAVSYYPYWHGSLDNLRQVLGYVAESYDKFTMVAETSYAYTLDDSDGHANTVSEFANCTGDDLLWDFSVQGQADAVRAVMAAVNDVPNAKGLGVFYWEGAWITVGDTTGLTGDAYNNRLADNKQLWDIHGCGWAASYSADYDPEDAGKYYGGSAVDNQTFFAPDGKALASLSVFGKVVPQKQLLGDADANGEVDVVDVACIQRNLARIETPVYNEASADVDKDGEVTTMDVTWIQRWLSDMRAPEGIGKEY